MMFRAGDTETKSYLFDAERIVAFADAAGDDNPLHRDGPLAGGSRFGGMIASGAHMSAVLLGFCASGVARHAPAVVLEFNVRFKRAIPAGAAATVVWTVTSAEPHDKLGGTMIGFDADITGVPDIKYVTATGKAVVWDSGAKSG